MAGKRLSEKQRRFVEAYTGVSKGNATDAARRAGYRGSENTLAQVGRDNLTKPQILEAIQVATAEVRSKAVADREECQAFLTSTMRGEECRSLKATMMGKLVTDEEDNPVEEPPPPKERVRSAELLLKMQGAFIERMDVKLLDALEEKLDELEQRMPPEAFAELLKALERTDEDDEPEDAPR